MGSIAVISIMILASSGILIGGFLLFRNVFDRIDEKWHDRWQYYKVIGVKSLRKAVTVALCIVRITFALIAGMCIHSQKGTSYNNIINYINVLFQLQHNGSNI